ncbi:MAG: hypothetical protein CVV33_10035 [Methanomicrobiales archaeon HGW-Methanomicrobiales-4]|nr:MAG: hypothetical protein CVV33_10035 [Methanomicrobiales archaeon HGW-Methanomicrobiales-4]
MKNIPDTLLLLKLKATIEHIEEELAECKKYIDLIETESNEGSNFLSEPLKVSNQKIQIIDRSYTNDLKTIVAKIEEEFKEDTFDSLSWLVSKESQLKREEIISILRDGGITMPKTLTKRQISGMVKQILVNRNSNNRTYLLRE